MSATYVLDTSALVGAWSRRYPPDLFPGFWDQMHVGADAGIFAVPQEVQEELKSKDDELQQWVTERQDHLVVPTSRAVMVRARDVLADHPRLTKPGKGRGRADPFVIALAAELDAMVITDEQGGSANKPKIPFVCQELGVRCGGILAFIRNEGWRF